MRLTAAVLLLFTVAGCSTTAPTTTPPTTVAPSSAAPPAGRQAQSATAAGPAPSVSDVPRAVKHVFPVLGKASYGRTHHDYPASDIIAACGLTTVSPVGGTVLEVSREDTYDKRVDDGATRGGLSVSIAGDDGVRYYLSHFSAIDAGVDAGAKVTAGQPIAKVGRTGLAGACHVHFGLSPLCARTGDWWIRRGVVWPWSYLDAWKAGTEKSPVADLQAYESKHGCPQEP